MLAHIVFFTLKDNSPEATQTFLESGKKYLSGHPGEVFFAMGTLNQELNREVNDRDFDVSLHVAFDSKESQDAYQTAEKHIAFIEENKDKWANVRVFDSDC